MPVSNVTKMPRKVAICVSHWGSEEMVHVWKWCKVHLLKTRDTPGGGDELYILHVNRPKEKATWDQGTAVVPDLSTALCQFNFHIRILEGEPGPSIVDFVMKNEIDVLLLGSRGRGVVKKAVMGSVIDFVVCRVLCACLIARSQVAAGETFRLKSVSKPASALLQQQQQQQPPAAPSAASAPSSTGGSPRVLGSPQYGFVTSLSGSGPLSRRVAIAYDTTAHGRYLMNWASENLLEATDTIFVVRAVQPKAPGLEGITMLGVHYELRKSHTMAATTSSMITDKHVSRLAGDALRGFANVSTYNLEGKPQQRINLFVEQEGVDLLVIGVYKDKSKKKGIAHKKVGATIYNRSACPCLVVSLTQDRLTSSVQHSELAESAKEEEELEDLDSEDDDEEGECEGDSEEDTVGKLPRSLTFDTRRVASGISNKPGTYVIELGKQGMICRMQPLEPGGRSNSSSDGGWGASGGPTTSSPGSPSESGGGAAAASDALQRSANSEAMLQRQLEEKETELEELRRQVKLLRSQSQMSSASRPATAGGAAPAAS